MRGVCALVLVVGACGADAPATVARCPDKLTTRGGLALTFDDAYLDDWTAAQPVFADEDARVTFFVAHTGDLTPIEWQELGDFAAAGHEIAAHTENHGYVVDYCQSKTSCSAADVALYVHKEVDPNLADFARHGLSPTDFAFPGGSYTPEVVDALAGRFLHLRRITPESPGDLLRGDPAFVPLEDGPRLIGAIGTDSDDEHTDDEYGVALERAYCMDETLVTYGHHIRDTAPPHQPITSYARIRYLVDLARQLGLELRRIDDLDAPPLSVAHQ